MVRFPVPVLAVLVLFLASAAASQTPSPAAAPPAAVRSILKAHCTDCHSGPKPAAGLSLDPAVLPAALLDRPSGAKPELRIVDTATPEKSYLLMKVRGADGIAGSRMPVRAAKLKDEDLRVLADWLAGLKKPAAAGPAGEAKRGPENPLFRE